MRISKRCVFPDFWWDFHWWSQEMDGHFFWHGGHQRLHLRQLCHIKYLSSKVWFLVCGCSIQRKDVVSLRVCRRRWGRSTRSLGAMRLVVNLFQTVERRLGFLQHHHHQIRKTLAAAVLPKIIFLRQNTEGSDSFACLVISRISPLSLSWPPYGQRTTLSQETKSSALIMQCSTREVQLLFTSSSALLVQAVHCGIIHIHCVVRLVVFNLFWDCDAAHPNIDSVCVPLDSELVSTYFIFPRCRIFLHRDVGQGANLAL